MILHLPGSEQYFHLQNDKKNPKYSILLNQQNGNNDIWKVQSLKSNTAPLQFVRIVTFRATNL